MDQNSAQPAVPTNAQTPAEPAMNAPVPGAEVPSTPAAPASGPVVTASPPTTMTDPLAAPGGTPPAPTEPAAAGATPVGSPPAPASTPEPAPKAPSLLSKITGLFGGKKKEETMATNPMAGAAPVTPAAQTPPVPGEAPATPVPNAGVQTAAPAVSGTTPSGSTGT